MEISLKSHLRMLEEKHISIEVRKSREELDEVLADDFFEIGSSGYLCNKKDCLDDGVELSDMRIYHYDIHPLSADVVLATYVIDNKTINRHTLRSSIWKHIDGRWQLYFHQGTITSMQMNEITADFTKVNRG